MEILFLGTGSAWCVPEHSCDCPVCREMRLRGESRTRTSFLIRCAENILVDCGPDFQRQMVDNSLERPDVLLITHEHADHFAGLDDLLAYRRALPEEAWIPVPTYASAQAWDSIKARFGYLMGSLIEPREAQPGIPLDGIKTAVKPFKTFHGPTAPGSLGYLVDATESDGETLKILYTSDFMRIDDEPDFLKDPDVLIMQTHWLNEPSFNRPNHMSFQNAVEYIRRWNPKKSTFLVHLSDSDQIPGDPYNNALKKLAPKSPMTPSTDSAPYPIPRCHEEWQSLVDEIALDMGLPGPIVVAKDGLIVTY